jgi:hypothetical protein
MMRLKDDALARRMSQAAYSRYWASPLTLDRHLDAVESVYENVRAEWGGPRPRHAPLLSRELS